MILVAISLVIYLIICRRLFLWLRKKISKTQRRIGRRREWLLPGQTWPGFWAISQRSEGTYSRLSREFGVSRDEIDDAFKKARWQGSITNFVKSLNALNYDENIVADQLILKAGAGVQP